MTFTPTHIWSCYVEGLGALAEPVTVIHTAPTWVRLADGTARRVQPSDVLNPITSPAEEAR